MELLIKNYILRNIKPGVFNLKKYKGISIKRLVSGCYNMNYLVKINSKKFVFRLSIHSDKFEGNNLESEYKLLKKLNGLHAPKVFYYNKKSFKYPLLVEEFIEGKRIHKLSNSLIIKIAKSLATVHLSIKPKASKSDSIKKFYSIRFKQRLKTIKRNPQMYKELFKYVVKALGYLDKKDKIFQKYYKKVLLHGDMHCNNIIIRKNKIVFIDWENNRFDDPTFDIVAFFYESENLQYFNENISKAYKNLFLKEYSKINPDLHLKDKLNTIYPLRWLSDTLWLACRIIEYEKIPLDLREKLKEEYLRLYNFNIKKLQQLWK